MAMNRRQFLKRTGLATAGAMLGPGLFSSPFVQRAIGQTIGDRYLIVLFLDGGNDGLNTITPVADGSIGGLRSAYHVARKTGSGGLRLSTSALEATEIGDCPGTDTPLALHPGLIGLKNLQDEYNSVAFVQGCGYPHPNLSHEESRIIWQTAHPLTPSNLGWVGQHLGAEYGSADIPGLCISNSVGLDFAQTTTNVLAIRRLSSFRFPYYTAYSSDRPAQKTAYESIFGASASSAQDLVRHVGAVGSVSLEAADNYPPLAESWDSGRAAYIRDGYTNLIQSGNRTVDSLREVSRVIYGVENDATGVAARFFRVTASGGFDTHSDQGGASGQHYDLHRDWGNAVEWFYRDMVDLGIADRVCIVVWSEFSRRIDQNDTGTDHGSQAPMFVIGGAVQGGIYGNHPNINSDALKSGNSVYSQDPANPYRSTDFRDVYGTVLKHWTNMSPGAVSTVLPIDPIADPLKYWRNPDFDMPFLT